MFLGGPGDSIPQEPRQYQEQKLICGHCGADGPSTPHMHDGLVRSMHLYQNEHDPDAPAKVSANG